jgi:hypothetical protein
LQAEERLGLAGVAHHHKNQLLAEKEDKLPASTDSADGTKTTIFLIAVRVPGRRLYRLFAPFIPIPTRITKALRQANNGLHHSHHRTKLLLVAKSRIYGFPCMAEDKKVLPCAQVDCW